MYPVKECWWKIEPIDIPLLTGCERWSPIIAPGIHVGVELVHYAGKFLVIILLEMKAICLVLPA
jgi:hypothetical protein